MWKNAIKTILLLLIFILCGCQSKSALTPTEFKNIMTNNKYKVSNITDNYQYDRLFKSYKATKHNYDIIYYKLNNKEQAINFYESSQVNLNLNKTNNKKETNVSTNNYNKYTLTTSDSYLILCRIDNTIIYSSVDIKYKNKVNSIIKKIGY